MDHIDPKHKAEFDSIIAEVNRALANMTAENVSDAYKQFLIASKKLDNWVEKYGTP